MAETLTGTGVPVLAAVTKADKIAKGRRPDRVREILRSVGVEEDQFVVTSARTREGVEELRKSINVFLAGAGI